MLLLYRVSGCCKTTRIRFSSWLSSLGILDLDDCLNPNKYINLLPFGLCLEALEELFYVLLELTEEKDRTVRVHSVLCFSVMLRHVEPGIPCLSAQ